AAPPHRDETLVRVASLRGLHRAGRRRAHQRLHVPDVRGVGHVCHDDRRSGTRRQLGPPPRSLHPARRSPMWLLHCGDAAGLQSAPTGASPAHQGTNWPLPQWECLSLWCLRPDSRGDPGRRGGEEGDKRMTTIAPGNYDPHTFKALTFYDATPRFHDGADTPRAYLERCLETIAVREPLVYAFTVLNEA